jgi:hypothetical protein
MDSIYQAILSSSHTLIEQVGRVMAPEQSGFGPFWVLLDKNKSVRAGDRKRLSETIEDSELLHRVCSRVDDGFEPAICEAGSGVVAAGQFRTERTNCGYMVLVLPGYCYETAEANADLIEMLMTQFVLLASTIEKNNQLHQAHLTQKTLQSPVLSGR